MSPSQSSFGRAWAFWDLSKECSVESGLPAHGVARHADAKREIGRGEDLVSLRLRPVDRGELLLVVRPVAKITNTRSMQQLWG